MITVLTYLDTAEDVLAEVTAQRSAFTELPFETETDVKSIPSGTTVVFPAATSLATVTGTSSWTHAHKHSVAQDSSISTASPETAIPFAETGVPSSARHRHSFTTTLSSVAAATTSSTETCPVEGGSCEFDGDVKCTLNGYARCDSGSWVVRPCSVGTVCKESGPLVYCDWVGFSTLSDSACGSYTHVKRDSSTSDDEFSDFDFAGKTPSNETLSDTSYTLKISIEQLNSTHAKGIIVASTVTNNPIGAHWKLSFASSLNITKVGRGAITSYDEDTKLYTVASIPLEEPSSNMAILIPFWATYK